MTIFEKNFAELAHPFRFCYGSLFLVPFFFSENSALSFCYGPLRSSGEYRTRTMLGFHTTASG